MVAQKISQILSQQPDLFSTLDIVSDGCCSCKNGNKYISFDKLKTKFCKQQAISELTSADMLLINQSENHWFFIEFKDLSKVSDPKKWFDRKEKQYNLMLKMTDSLLILSTYLSKLSQNQRITHTEYFSAKQSFFIVYKTTSPRTKIHQHLSNNIQRYQFVYRNILVINHQNFYNWLS